MKRIVRASAYFKSHLGHHAVPMSSALALALAAVGMQLLRPWPIKILFDVVLMPRPAGEDPWLDRLSGIPPDTVILGACAGLLGVSVLWGIFSYGQAFLTARTGQSFVYALRSAAYSHLQRLSLGFHQRRQRGDLLMRMTGDINSLRDLLVDSVIMAVTSIMMLVVMVSILFAMDWRLALTVVALLPFIGLATFRFSFEIRDAARKQRKREGRIAAMVGEMLGSIALIQAFGGEDQQARQFQRSNRQSLKAGLRTTRLEASMARFIEILIAAGTAAVLGYGVMRVRAGALTPGDLLVFSAYAQSSFRPLRRLARVSARVAKAVVCAERVAEFLTEEPDVRDEPDAKRLRETRGAFELLRVSLQYAGGQRALKNVSLSIEPGSFVGVVGPSGAGKSSLLALLLRLYDPTRGKVRLDGRDLRRYRVQSLREQMSVVLQEPLLFSGSVRENIIFGSPGASEEAIVRAARLANAHRFIEALPDGYDTKVAETGATLSGGERQRICIARAFLRDAPILLLDEPTFGLDAGAEKEVLDALERLVRGRTAIVVAHRLSTLCDADRILVMKKGHLVADGSHEQLLAAGGWYAHAFALQNGAPAAAESLARINGPRA